MTFGLVVNADRPAPGEKRLALHFPLGFASRGNDPSHWPYTTWPRCLAAYPLPRIPRILHLSNLPRRKCYTSVIGLLHPEKRHQTPVNIGLL